MSSPTLYRRYVALQLRSMRDNAGLKREAVAKEIGTTVGHVGHVETMHSLPKQLEVRALLKLYGEEDRTEQFLAVVDAARTGTDWFVSFPGRPPWLDMLLAMQSGAASIHSYDAMVVRGLFQTPAYAAAIIRAGLPNLSDAEIQERVDLRMARQDVLHRRPEPVHVRCVLDESVLYRRAEDPGVLAEQLEHLVQLTELPNVHIQVLPFSAIGLHAAINGTFHVLHFSEELENDPGVAYVESVIGGTYYEDSAEIARYEGIWDQVQRQALTTEESRAVLARRVEEIA